MNRNIKIVILAFLAVILIVFIGIDCISKYFFTCKIDELYPRFEMLKIILQVSGGFAVLLGLWISIRTLILNEKNIAHTAESLRLSYEGLKTERLKISIENLASNSVETRIAGFYSLIGIAKTEPIERENICNILTSFLRNRTSANLILPDEVQILMNLMFRFENKDLFSKIKINLENVNLSNLNLNDSMLMEASLHESNIKNVYLIRSNLRSSFITNAKLENVELEYCDLTSSAISRSKLSHVSFSNSDLTGVYFNGSELKNCHFGGAKGIQLSSFALATSIENVTGIDLELITSLKEQYPKLIIN